jgi:hypothetical protein
MEAQLKKRLAELKSEYENGHKALVGLQEKQLELKSTLLRISGAMQVLEELLKHEQSSVEETHITAVK